MPAIQSQASGGGVSKPGGAMSSMAISALTGKAKAGAKGADDDKKKAVSAEEEEDPIVKAEREFFDLIKKEQGGGQITGLPDRSGSEARVARSKGVRVC